MSDALHAGASQRLGSASAEHYDELPYPNLVHGRSHPRTTGAMAVLYGLDAPPVESARVLDLGTAAGANLIAMAAELPKARFVGVDVSPRQIEAGRQMARDLGLDNLNLVCASFEELPEVEALGGPFDYVICHGVFSWVPPALRQVILDLVARVLSPRGVAYISYNTYPGWHFGNIVRELMLRETNPQMPALERVLAARRALEKHVEASEDKSLRRALLVAERELLSDHTDSYLFHEYLTPEHHPLWFSDFVAAAAEAGLSYVTDALPGIVLGATQAANLAEVLRDVHDPIAVQSAIDQHLNNRFRRSLLVRAGANPGLTLSPATLSRLHVRIPRDHFLVRDGGRRPADAEGPDADFGEMRVKNRRGALVPLAPPMVPVLERLRTASPGTIAWSELVDFADADARFVSGSLVGLVFGEVLEVSLTPVTCATHLPERPNVPALNRYQARHGDPIASRLFASEGVGDVGAAILALCDGTRSPGEIRDAVVVARGVTPERVEQLMRVFVERGIFLAE